MGIQSLSRYLTDLIATLVAKDGGRTTSAMITEPDALRQYPISVIAIDAGYLLYRAVDDVIRKDDTGDTDDLATVHHRITSVCIDSIVQLIHDHDVGDRLVHAHLVLDGIPPMNKIRSHLSRTTAQLIQRTCEQAINAQWHTSPDRPAMLHNRDIPIYPRSPITISLEHELERLSRSESDLRSGIKITYSGSDEPGEGETKVAAWCQRWLRKRPAAHMLVIGADTDLLLSPMINYRHNYHVMLQNRTTGDSVYHIPAIVDAVYRITMAEYQCQLKKPQFIYGLIWLLHIFGNEVLPMVIHPNQLPPQELLRIYCQVARTFGCIIDYRSKRIYVNQHGLADVYRLIHNHQLVSHELETCGAMYIPETVHRDIADMRGCRNLWANVIPKSEYLPTSDDLQSYLYQMCACLQQIIVPDTSILLDWYPQGQIVMAENLMSALVDPRHNSRGPVICMEPICRYIATAPRLTDVSAISYQNLNALLWSDPDGTVLSEYRQYLPSTIAQEIAQELIYCKDHHQTSRWSTTYRMLQIGPLPTIPSEVVYQIMFPANESGLPNSRN